MARWIKHATDVTIAYGNKQGREFTLPSFGVPWKLVTYHQSGVRRTIGIWGKDSRNRDIIIYNGAYSDGQEILIDASYKAVHVAVNFIPDNPPKNKRWYIQGQYYRQAYHDAKVQVEKYYYK